MLIYKHMVFSYKKWSFIFILICHVSEENDYFKNSRSCVKWHFFKFFCCKFPLAHCGLHEDRNRLSQHHTEALAYPEGGYIYTSIHSDNHLSQPTALLGLRISNEGNRSLCIKLMLSPV